LEWTSQGTHRGGPLILEGGLGSALFPTRKEGNALWRVMDEGGNLVLPSPLQQKNHSPGTEIITGRIFLAAIASWAMEFCPRGCADVLRPAPRPFARTASAVLRGTLAHHPSTVHFPFSGFGDGVKKLCVYATAFVTAKETMCQAETVQKKRQQKKEKETVIEGWNRHLGEVIVWASFGQAQKRRDIYGERKNRIVQMTADQDFSRQ